MTEVETSTHSPTRSAEPRHDRAAQAATTAAAARPDWAGYRNIVVHLKATEDRSEHIEVAFRLASRFGAELTGVLTQREPSIFKKLYKRDAWPLERLEAFEGQAAEAGERFRADATARGLSVAFETAEGDAAELLGYVGRLYDLVIVEQTDLTSDEIGFDVPEHCLASTGRPVLVVPNSGAYPEIGRRVLVAWNGSREAALAITHALPFLQSADEVILLEGPRKEAFPSVTKWPRVSIRDYLGRHCRNLEARKMPEGVDPGAAILEVAAATGSDLVVMGAYGRSWLAEWVLGGATRHVLRHSRVPLLMAH